MLFRPMAILFTAAGRTLHRTRVMLLAVCASSPLEQAQQMAASANDPLQRLAQLQAEAAKEHRLGVQGLYFPNVSSQFENLHFNQERRARC